jgi:hypothetical protein
MTTHKLFAGMTTLELPAEWDDRSIYTFVAPEQTRAAPTMARAQSFRPNVVVTREPCGAYDRPEAYAKDQLAESRKQLPQLRVIEENATAVGGKPGFARLFTFVAPPQNVTVQQLQAFVIAAEWVYTFTFSGLPETFAEQRVSFDKILSQLVVS